jgi:hypothetical protein
VAIELGMSHGGWCPRGRRAEDGVIPARYGLEETAERDYSVRTERNVLDSDATLILTVGTPSGGTALTSRLARTHGKPHLIVDLAAPDVDGARAWLEAEQPATVNVAGPRESGRPGIGARARAFLRAIWT